MPDADRRFKRVIGDGLRSRTDRRRATEVGIAVHAMNRMLALGRPEYVRLPWQPVEMSSRGRPPIHATQSVLSSCKRMSNMVLMPNGADDRKKDAVYRTILDCFLSGQYRFGDSVSVRALSESIGVSRQPVMAAFNRLSLEGFVTVTAQVGCQVVTPSATEISDFFLLFSRYEGLMAELAAKRCTDRDVRAMRVANAAITMLSAADDPSGAEYRELNRTFHSTVHEGSHSQSLKDRSQSAWTMSDFLIAQTYGFTPYLQDAAAEHDAIISAIEDHDPGRARMAAERHILNVADLVARGIEKDVAA